MRLATRLAVQAIAALEVRVLDQEPPQEGGPSLLRARDDEVGQVEHLVFVPVQQIAYIRTYVRTG